MRIKRGIFYFLAVGLTAVMLAGCTEHETEEAQVETEVPQEAEEPAEQDADTEESFAFSELKGLRFVFSSGAGGWSTFLSVDQNGGFRGEYYDSDMGSSSEEYPRGVCRESRFTGKFGQAVKINDYTYSMKIEEIQYEREPGTEEIQDGMLYSYTDAYGLEGNGEFYLYTPSSPLEELPEHYRSWVGYYELPADGQEELSFWGLYNQEQECGFSSYDLVENIQRRVENTESAAQLLRDSLENDSLNQSEMNDTAALLYEEWDNILNEIWDTLTQVLEEEQLEELRQEQIDWIVEKEKAAAQKGEEVQGGSLYPLVVSMEAARLTEERVYELETLLEQEFSE